MTCLQTVQPAAQRSPLTTDLTVMIETDTQGLQARSSSAVR